MSSVPCTLKVIKILFRGRKIVIGGELSQAWSDRDFDALTCDQSGLNRASS